MVVVEKTNKRRHTSSRQIGGKRCGSNCGALVVEVDAMAVTEIALVVVTVGTVLVLFVVIAIVAFLVWKNRQSYHLDPKKFKRSFQMAWDPRYKIVMEVFWFRSCATGSGFHCCFFLELLVMFSHSY